jgi:hypothetical protein
MKPNISTPCSWQPSIRIQPGWNKSSQQWYNMFMIHFNNIHFTLGRLTVSAFLFQIQHIKCISCLPKQVSILSLITWFHCCNTAFSKGNNLLIKSLDRYETERPTAAQVFKNFFRILWKRKLTLKKVTNCADSLLKSSFPSPVYPPNDEKHRRQQR